MAIYWYISEAKIKTLDAASGFLSGIAAELSFKFPLLEGKLSGKNQEGLVKQLERVVTRLKKEKKPQDFDAISTGETPTLVSFSGRAGRIVDETVFWCVMKGEHNALLLAGSPGYAIGKPPVSGTTISPSADPVGALRSTFQEPGQVHMSPVRSSLSSSLSYAWQEIARESFLQEGSVPEVEGIAVFARSVAGDLRQLRRANSGHLQLLIVGSPLYVKQV